MHSLLKPYLVDVKAPILLVYSIFIVYEFYVIGNVKDKNYKQYSKKLN